MDLLIDSMNYYIEQAEENVNIERFSYAFKDNEDLQKKYDSYVDQLELTVSNKEHTIKSIEVTQYLTSGKWSEQLISYCEEHYNEFFSGDIDNIIQFTKEVEQINFMGINKPMAKKALVDYLNVIIKRLRIAHSL